MTLWYLTDDLMFSSRVLSFAERAGHSVVMIASPALLASRISQAAGDEPQLVIVDLSLPGLQPADVVPELRAAAPSAKIIAYGPHVHVAKLAAAQAAGCDEVMSNGQFDRGFPALLGS
jgi:DNA-binding NarL/FixJ family response regulator